MRIISGNYKGRKLNPPMNLPVRPTTDFAKEGLFNILRNIVDFEQVRVLDLFTGTGSIAFEFVSRGVVEVNVVDNNVACLKFIEKTKETLQINNLNVFHRDVFQFLDKTKAKYDLIFADPPYDMPNFKDIYTKIFENDLLNEDGWLIIEHPKEVTFAGLPYIEQQRHYGKVNFSFFHKTTEE